MNIQLQTGSNYVTLQRNQRHINVLSNVVRYIENQEILLEKFRIKKDG